MSKRNNVNPGQYKVGGREKPGTPTGTEVEPKQSFAQSKKHEVENSGGRAAPKENRKS
jgi:hypothetical protein